MDYRLGLAQGAAWLPGDGAGECLMALADPGKPSGTFLLTHRLLRIFLFLEKSNRKEFEIMAVHPHVQNGGHDMIIAFGLRSRRICHETDCHRAF